MSRLFTFSNRSRNSLLTGATLALSILLGAHANAQTALGLTAESSSGKTLGPSVVPQVAALYAQEARVPAGIQVKASFSSQVYTDVKDNVTGTGLQFGGTQNMAGISAGRQSLWTQVSSVSSPSNEQFAGADVAENYAFPLFTAARPLAEAAMATNGRHLMGQLTLSFSKPVNDPVLHLAGLGGTAGELGFTTELELINSDIVLRKTAGNNNLEVSGNQIINSAFSPDASSHSGAASGSILAKGLNISTLTFNVYLKGDGGADIWEKSNQYNGDRWLVSVSANSSNASARNTVALPIYITNYNVVHEKDCSATLRWKTSTELGVSHFYIEHSTDGTTFNVVHDFPCEGRSEGDYYAYTYRTNNGPNYFRLRTRDILADSNYTPVARVLVTCSERPIEVFPNPAQDFLKIRGASSGETARLTNMFGKVMRAQVINSIDANLDLTGLQTGIYMLIITNEQGQEISRTRINKQ